MRHTFDVYRAGERKATTTDPSLRDVLNDLGVSTIDKLFDMGYNIQVTDNVTNLTIAFFSEDEFDEYWSQLEYAESMRREAEADFVPADPRPLRMRGEPSPVIEEKQDATRPKHHTDFLDHYQWLDVESRKPRYRNDPDGFIHAVHLQVDKYMDRCGRKDNELQEYEKANFYLNYIIEFIKNGKKPILAEDIHKKLGR
jgi:hypothetical protein